MLDPVKGPLLPFPIECPNLANGFFALFPAFSEV